MFDWDPRALRVLHTLEEKGFPTFFVGGCVRDSLLGIPLHDYDAATAARPEEILAACAQFPCLKMGIKHGTVTVLSDGLAVEVTAFRKETTYSDHRHPDGVEFTQNLNEDLARRDFTVNAMAWNPRGLTDPFGGQADLKHRLVRCVGDPHRRFEEDALRLLRGLRLSAQLGFSIHPDTAAAIHAHGTDLTHVAWERIQTEFLRLLCSPGAEEVLLAFPDVVCRIIPELAPSVGFDQHSIHHCHDVYTHSVLACVHTPPVPEVRLAALLHDVGKPATFFLDGEGEGHFYGHPGAGLPLAEAALRRLRVSTSCLERVLLLIRRHDLPVEPTRQWVGRWLTRLGEDAFFQLLEVKRGDRAACAHPQSPSPDPLDICACLARQLLEEQACLSLKDLAVNGRDCLGAGLRGPAIGRTLASLLERVSEGELENSRETLLPLLKP